MSAPAEGKPFGLMGTTRTFRWLEHRRGTYRVQLAPAGAETAEVQPMIGSPLLLPHDDPETTTAMQWGTGGCEWSAAANLGYGPDGHPDGMSSRWAALLHMGTLKAAKMTLKTAMGTDCPPFLRAGVSDAGMVLSGLHPPNRKPRTARTKAPPTVQPVALCEWPSHRHAALGATTQLSPLRAGKRKSKAAAKRAVASVLYPSLAPGLCGPCCTAITKGTRLRAFSIDAGISMLSDRQRKRWRKWQRATTVSHVVGSLVTPHCVPQDADGTAQVLRQTRRNGGVARMFPAVVVAAMPKLSPRAVVHALFPDDPRRQACWTWTYCCRNQPPYQSPAMLRTMLATPAVANALAIHGQVPSELAPTAIDNQFLVDWAAARQVLVDEKKKLGRFSRQQHLALVPLETPGHPAAHVLMLTSMLYAVRCIQLGWQIQVFLVPDVAAADMRPPLPEGEHALDEWFAAQAQPSPVGMACAAPAGPATRPFPRRIAAEMASWEMLGREAAARAAVASSPAPHEWPPLELYGSLEIARAGTAMHVMKGAADAITVGPFGATLSDLVRMSASMASVSVETDRRFDYTAYPKARQPLIEASYTRTTALLENPVGTPDPALVGVEALLLLLE